MAFPNDWLENPPEIPPNGEKAPNNMAQLASHFRKLVQSGTASVAQMDWLYDFERIHTPAGMRTAFTLHEKKTSEERSLTVSQEQGAAQVAYQEGRRLDRVVDSLAEGIRELRSGFTTVLGELRQGIAALNEGFQEVRVGNQQLQADQRSFLGILFPHTEKLLQVSNESMEAYRKAVLKEAEAVNATAAAQNSGETSAAEKIIVDLVTEGARQKLGLSSTPKLEAKPKAPAPTEEKKA